MALKDKILSLLTTLTTKAGGMYVFEAELYYINEDKLS